MSYLDVDNSRKKGKFLTTVYRKPTLSGVYNNFDSFSFLQSTDKFAMRYTLVYRCFTLCSDSTNIHKQVS